MAKEKTKKLLDKLNDITGKPKPTERPTFIPETNKIWKSVLEDGIRSLPKVYDKTKWIEEKDEDGNIDHYTYHDRIYGGGGASQEHLVNKDGTEYQGKLHSKRVRVKLTNGTNTYTYYRLTTDGRWFDSSGMPCDPPAEIEDERDDDETTEEAQAEETKE
tara:strand:+ start:6678 stop:7157 length:480 start_codon:yes stop_codon:yes gene_type:complete